jgi:large exoprotein involved in heme utilization and adhesion
VFGQNARLQIGGSFFASTASGFKFSDGSEFSATNPQAPPLLTVNVPLGLQYGRAIGDIQQAGQLAVTDGQSLTLYGNTVMNRGAFMAAGGTVQLLGDRVALLDSTRIDVSSPAGGGTVQIGGDLQGQGTLPTATATYIAPGAILHADGISAPGNGTASVNGGTIVVWSNVSTKAYGTFTARAGQTGKGGLIETSSAGVVDVAGIQVDAAATNGSPGTWLIDPRDITIQNVGASTNGTFSGSNPDIFTPTADSAIISTTDIENRLNAGTNVTITTGNTGTQAGNITIADSISKDPFGGPTSLTLSAANDIILQPGVQIQSFFVPFTFNPLNLTLQADSDNSGSGNVILNGQISTNAGQVSLSGRTIALTNGSISSGIPGTPNVGITGGAGAITLTADVVSLDNSRLQADTYGGGDGQAIAINAGSISLNNNSAIGTTTWTPTNNAGNININTTGAVLINGNSSVFSTSNGFSPTQAGDAGFITINAGSVLLNQGAIASTGNAQGLAGIAIRAIAGSVNVTNGAISSVGRGGNGAPTTITATDQVRLTNSFVSSRGLNRNAGAITLEGNQVEIANTTILAQSYFSGTGGAISITAKDSVALTDDSRLSNETYGMGNAGSLNVKAGSNLLVKNSVLTNSTYAEGNAGALTLTAPRVTLDSAAQVLSIVRANFGVPNASGNGGAVTVDAQTLSLTAGSTLSTSTFGDGNAGQVLIKNADSVVLAGSTIASAVNPTSTGNGGNIDLQTRSLLLTDGGQITANTAGSGRAGDIVVNSRDRVTLTGANTGLFAQTTSATGAGGNIIVDTSAFQIANIATLNATTSSQSSGGSITVNANTFNGTTGSQLLTTTFGSGSAGNITVTAANQFNLSDANTGLFASTISGASGNGGSITVKSGAATISDRALISANSNGFGNAGDINITAQQVTVQTAGSINSSTANTGAGGNIAITANQFVTVLNASSLITTQANPGSTGNAGNLNINTGQLQISSGAQVASSTFGTGNAGTLTVKASDLVELSGTNPAGTAGSALNVSANLGSTGNGGILAIDTQRLIVRDGAQIGAGTFSSGSGGSLDINAADSIQIIGRGATAPSGLFSSVEAGATGSAKNITLNTARLLVQKGGIISVATSGSGNGGSLNINATDFIELVGRDSQLSSQTSGSGNGGNIVVANPALVSLQDGASIKVGSQGSGQSGSLRIQTDRLVLNNQASLSAEAASTQGGNITLDIQDLLLLRRNSLISATAGTAQSGGDGGNITINSPQGFIIGVLSENSDIRANAFSGNGGRITITTQGIFGLKFQPRDTPISDITASSQFGFSGTVILNTLNIDPNQGLVALPVNLVDPSSQIISGCSPSRTGDRTSNRFVVTGRGGLPLHPNEALSGDRTVVEPIDAIVEQSQMAQQHPIAAPQITPQHPILASTPCSNHR